MVCTEKARLIDTYVATTSAFVSVVTQLRSATNVEFEQFLTASVTAAKQCEVARRALRNHQNEHGC